MRTNIAIGGEIEVATADEVRGIVQESTDSITGMLRSRGVKPLRRTIPTSARAVLNVPTVLDFGSPPSGSTWCLVDVVVTGADDRTLVANTTGALYVGDPANIMLGNLLRPAQAIPGFWSFSKEVIFAHYNDSVFVVVYGAAADQGLAAVARIHQYSEDTIEANRM